MSTAASTARGAGAKAGADIRSEFSLKFPEFGYSYQELADGIPTVWVQAGRLKEVLRWLKSEAPKPDGAKSAETSSSGDNAKQTEKKAEPKAETKPAPAPPKPGKSE